MTAREEVKEIELGRIRATQGNERLRDIDTLAKSIAAIGLQIPLIVQHIDNEVDQYRLVDGHRRFAALKKNKSKTARVIEIDADIAGDKMQTIQLTANLHRLQLTPFEEAAAIKKLRDDGRETKDIAADLGLTSQAVARREQLNKLIPEWLKYIAEMGESEAVSVAAFELIASYEPSTQGKILQSMDFSAPTVSTVKNILSRFDRQLRSAPWKLDDATLHPAAGACHACPKRSSCQSLLFEGETDGKKAAPEDKCLDIACWNHKLERFGKLKLEEAKKKHPNLVLIKKDEGYGSSLNKAIPNVSRGMKVIVPNRWSSDKGYEVVKKTDKDAVPAMTINEKGFGQISYIKITKKSESKSTNTVAKNLSPEEQMKVERKTLAGRRAKWMLEQLDVHLAESINKSKLPAGLSERFPAEQLVLLGTLCLLTDEYGRRTKVKLEDWQNVDTKQAADALWKIVSDTINMTPFYGDRQIDLYLKELPEARQIAEIVFGLNWSDLEAEAVKAIPDPTPKAGATPKKKAAKK